MAINGYTTTLAGGLQDRIWGKATYTPGTNFYVALFTTAPEPDASGGVEVSGGSYARVSTVEANWNTATLVATTYIMRTTNAIEITFPPATASWGTVVSYGIFDAATAGNLLLGGNLTVAKLIDTGSTPAFLIDQLVINIQNQ